MIQNATISLRRDDGRSLEFSSTPGDPVRLNHGSTGLGIAPVTFDTSPVLAGHGSMLRGKRLAERDILVPLMLEGTNTADLDRVRGELMHLVSPLDPTPLRLRVVPPGGGTYREMRVHYAGGLEGDFGKSYWGYAQRIALELKALDALWAGEPVTTYRQVRPSVKPFLSDSEPFFPVVLSSATVTGELSLTVEGDAPTWPVWSVVPPGEDFLIARPGTRERFYIDGIISQPFEVDMEEGRVEDVTGADMWPRVSLDSQLFQLPPGENRLEFTMIGATEASSIAVAYRPRFMAAL